MRIRHGIVLFVMLLVCISAYAEKRKTQRKSFLGKAPLEIVAEDEHWLGIQPPVTLAALKGKVVWLQFNFSENCTSTSVAQCPTDWKNA